MYSSSLELLMTIPLDELLVFDMFYVCSYFIMLLYYYTVEYKSRFEFYEHTTQLDYQLSYKKFLDRMPNGIILIDKRNNTPVFYNRVIAKIIARRRGISSSNTQSYEGSEDSLEEAKVVIRRNN